MVPSQSGRAGTTSTIPPKNPLLLEPQEASTLQSGAEALGRSSLQGTQGVIEIRRIVLRVRGSDAVRFPPERFGVAEPVLLFRRKVAQDAGRRQARLTCQHSYVLLSPATANTRSAGRIGSRF